MSDELRAARERLRLAQIKWVAAYESGNTPTQLKDELWIQDMMLIVDAYLTEHPADDDEPVTTKWLLSIAEAMSSSESAATCYQCRIEDCGANNVLLSLLVKRPHLDAVRRLLAALGIEVPK